MATRSIRLFRRLEGLFCVYKPPGVHWKHVRDRIETSLLEGITSAAASPSQRLPHAVKCVSEPCRSNNGPTELDIAAVSVPLLANHALVCGPEFRHIKVGVGHRLDVSSSGVLVIGVGNGNKVLNDLHQTCVTRDYTLEGQFGMATHSFSDTGRIMERTTYDHITQDKLEKVLAMLHGANQKALLMYSNIDMCSQEAYEMAVQGVLGPDGKSPPILKALRIKSFKPPHFTLEVQCLNETQKYLRKVVHEIGLELRSTAACTAVRRTRDGPFTLHQALTRHQWTASGVMLAVQEYHASKEQRKCLPTRSKHLSPQRSEENGISASQTEICEETRVPQ